MKKLALHWKIIIGMVLGVLFGLLASKMGWIDFTNNGSILFSFNGSADAQTQQPIDITINGLYPDMTLEDLLSLYKNLFNIDESNWKQAIGGN